MKQKGFTILFAVLVSSIVLALGLGIVAITMKEVQLSGTGRDSQLAFYAADSGAECAFYWDLKGVNGESFATSSPGFSNLDSMTCVGGEILSANNANSDVDGIGVLNSADASNATTTFWIYMEGASAISKSCAKIQVGKHKDLTTGDIKTIIDSRGYNTCDTSNARRLERGYQINY